MYDFFYLAEAAAIGLEEEIEMQSRMYSRLAYQVVVPHIDAEKMGFEKWMDMWHPTERQEQDKERILKQGREIWEKLENGELFNSEPSEGEDATMEMFGHLFQ